MVVGEVGALLTSERLPDALLAAVGVKLTVNAADLPGATVSGRVRPLKPKPLPETVACETFRLALPGLLSVIVCVLVVPTVTLPKLALAGTTEICGSTPAPESAIVAGELVALLSTDTLPVTLPVAVGAKATFSEALCPAARVNGRVIPLTLNPAPATFTCEMLTLLLPVLLSLTL